MAQGIELATTTQQAHIADTTHAGADLAGALTDIENLTIAVNAILVALEECGILATG